MEFSEGDDHYKGQMSAHKFQIAHFARLAELLEFRDLADPRISGVGVSRITQGREVVFDSAATKRFRK